MTLPIVRYRPEAGFALRAASGWDAVKFWIYCHWRWAGVVSLLGQVKVVAIPTDREQNGDREPLPRAAASASPPERDAVAPQPVRPE